MGPAAKDYPVQYFCASALAASGCYPLWRSAAIGQSGFRVATMHLGGVVVPQSLTPYVYGFLPPYKGMVATVVGMTWARAAIFWTSDYAKEHMLRKGYSEASATVLPPLVVGSIVQIVNQPIVRATVTLQDPKYNIPNVFQSIRHIYSTHGIQGLWHGTSAAILKTVPKYCTAVAVKDWMEMVLPQPDPSSPTYESDRIKKSALKSATAGIAGAALTNPLDVIRNEMFKTNLSMRDTAGQLWKDVGWRFMGRGLGKNMVAVALPIGCTIFFTEELIQRTQNHKD